MSMRRRVGLFVKPPSLDIYLYYNSNYFAGEQAYQLPSERAYTIITRFQAVLAGQGRSF